MSDDQPKVPLAVFEGDAVTALEAVIPRMVMELEESYPRNTILRMQVEFRVRSVQHNEDRKGDLTRVHNLTIESVGLLASFRPEDVVDSVGGSASGQPEQTPEEAAELGLELNRTGDQWHEGMTPRSVDPAEVPARSVDDLVDF